MPVVQPDKFAPPETQPNIPQITPQEYRGVTVDTRYEPQSALLTNIEGSSWTVNFYAQVTDKDNDLSGQQLGRDPVNQQYRLIHKLELKVQQPLVQQQNQESKQFKVTGTAMVYPFLIPQEGDMFLADIGDGREALFQISGSERRTYYKQSCFQIEYTLVDYATAERRGDLNRKVIEELYYRRDFLIHGQNPLLIKADYAAVSTLSDRYYSMLDTYLNMFGSREFLTIVAPKQPGPTYDHFLMKAVTAMFNIGDSPTFVEYRLMNVDDKDVMRCFTIWDAILQCNNQLMPFINKKMCVLSTLFFTEQPMYEGIRHTGLQYAVYPADPEINVNYEVIQCDCDHDRYERQQLCAVPSRPGLLQQMIGNRDLSGLPYHGAPVIKEVLCDDYYIFSKEFYEGGSGLSMLELLVKDYLNGRALDRQTLVLFTDIWQAWPGLERFYYIPIVLALIRANIRTI